MKKFSGQYVAKFILSTGEEGSLMINADHDKNGEGIAYVVGSHQIGIQVFDCTAMVADHESLQGYAKRSEQREKTLAPDQKRTENSTREIAFKIFQNSEQHVLMIYSDDSNIRIPLIPIDTRRRVQAERLNSWKEFLDWVNEAKSLNRFSIFRGISRASYGLKTSFHRKMRVDLERYRDFDLPTFTDLAETIGRIRFDGDNGALWGFAQHHGFPSPLLDWTASPFIAAYFAFHERLESSNQSEDEPVRIYSLNGDFVSKNQPSTVPMVEPFPRVWILKPNSKGNQRLIFQQGIFLHSNVVDIEAYLLSLTMNESTSILNAIDMPASMSINALDQLSYMGISHLSLFPGLDGAAKHAAFQSFHLGS